MKWFRFVVHHKHFIRYELEIDAATSPKRCDAAGHPWTLDIRHITRQRMHHLLLNRQQTFSVRIQKRCRCQRRKHGGCIDSSHSYFRRAVWRTGNTAAVSGLEGSICKRLQFFWATGEQGIKLQRRQITVIKWDQRVWAFHHWTIMPNAGKSLINALPSC